MPVTWATFVGVCVMLPLATLLGVWLYDEYWFHRRRFVPTTRVMARCDICLHQFLCDKDVRLSRCPQCGNLIRNRDALH